jgi:uncharacterized protein YecE (DUF72 family)
MQQTLFETESPALIPSRSLWKLHRRGIHLGTSGYSYDDWIGPFYPHRTKKAQMLEYYQQFFPAVELNYTYYTMPRPSTLFQIRNKAPHTVFSVKAHGSMTHERKAIRQEWRDFADALLVLADTDQLACVLFQFPYSFKCSHEQYHYLDEIIDYFDAFRLVFEFRHTSWHQHTTAEYARTRKVTLCSVDAPALPGLTSSVVHPSQQLAYYRLHGRNADNWFSGDNVTRYDYSYSDQEIKELIRNIYELLTHAADVYIFANNHPRAQAVETVTAIAEALDQTPSLETV